MARLEAEGRMQPAGREAVERAKADGRWDAAYAGQASAVMPEDFLVAIAARPAAQTAWEALDKTSKFQFYFRLQNLKTAAGREKRIRSYVESLDPSSRQGDAEKNGLGGKRGRGEAPLQCQLPKERRTRSGRISKRP